MRRRLRAALQLTVVDEGGEHAEPEMQHSVPGTAMLTLQDREDLLAGLLLAAGALGTERRGAVSSGGFVAALDPRTRRRLTVQMVSDFLVAQAREGPLALSLEDLHWADTESLAVAATLAGACSAVPLLLLVQARPEVELPWLALPHAQVLRLGSFTVAHTAALLEATLSQPSGAAPGGLPPAPGPSLSTADLAARLHAATRGNPYFLVELVSSLLERGQLVPAGDGWHLAESGPRLPATIRRLLEARIDALDPTARRVLAEAAVIGQTFYDLLLENISAQPWAVPSTLREESVRRYEALRDLIGAQRALNNLAPRGNTAESLRPPSRPTGGARRWRAA